jgi:formate-dependent nitrite reductase membrane component NrfD
LKKLNFAVPEPWQRRLAALGLPLSAGVGIYTGVLLGAVQSRPFWNTNIVAQLFLFSALSSGCAAIMLALAWRNEALESLSFRTLLGFDAILLMLELFIVIPYVIHGELSVQAVKDSMRLILGGPFTIPFWIFFAGLGVLAPLGLELVGLASSRHNRRMIAVTASLILAGGFVLRYIFVFAGQMSTFN